MSSTTQHGIAGVSWRRSLLYVACGFAIYLLCAGPITRFAPEIADWLYAPIRPLANVPVVGSAIRKWISLWGVDVGE